MSALITSSIPSQNFELIRNKIGELLAIELKNQYVLDNTYPNIQKVWVERYIPIDITEFPTVNVNMQGGPYDTKTQRSVSGNYTFNIDVYVNAMTSEATGMADQYAMILMQKILGMIRAILSAPAYNTLTFTNGSIGGTMVDNIFIGSKKDIKDSLSEVIGRLIFSVRAVEQMIITAVPVPLERATTTITINESDKGFYYDYNPVV